MSSSKASGVKKPNVPNLDVFHSTIRPLDNRRAKVAGARFKLLKVASELMENRLANFFELPSSVGLWLVCAYHYSSHVRSQYVEVDYACDAKGSDDATVAFMR